MVKPRFETLTQTRGRTAALTGPQGCCPKALQPALVVEETNVELGASQDTQAESTHVPNEPD